MDENKIKIVVCGDSFCNATTLSVPNQGLRGHFSQILEDAYGYNVINIACGGMSTTGICFQIRDAIKMKPNFIVYNRTWPDRIDLVLRDETFTEDKGLRNFAYVNPHFSSYGTEYVGNKDEAAMYSAPWQGIDQQSFIEISKEQVKAVELYLKYMFDWSFKQEIDNWMYDYWHGQIEKNGIVPLLFNDPSVGRVAYDYSAVNPIDCPYHTDKATQEVVAANIDRIIKHGKNI